MNRIFLDMDGVIVDFDGFAAAFPDREVKSMVGAYQQMRPLPGALAGVRSLIGMGFDVWLATKPPTGVAHAYADKASWVFQYLPELKRKLILTHDKGLLGEPGDWLVDDRPHRANCESFKGALIPFGAEHDHDVGRGWTELVSFFSAINQRRRQSRWPETRNYSEG